MFPSSPVRLFRCSLRFVPSVCPMPPRPTRRKGSLRRFAPIAPGRVGSAGRSPGCRVGSVFGLVSLVWSLGGVSWLVLGSRLRRSRRRWSVLLASRSRPGRVVRWAFPSAPRRAPFPGLSPSCGFPRLPLRPGFRRPGVAGSPVRAAWFPFAPFARCPPPLAFRPRGWCPFPLRRRRFRCAGVARRAAWPPCLRRAAAGRCPLGRSRVPVSRPRRGRVFRWPPLAGGLPAPGGRRGAVGAGRWPVGGGRVRAGRGSLRARGGPWRGGVRGLGVWLRSRCVCRPLGGAGARRGRWWPRFRSGRVPLLPLLARFAAVLVVVVVFLWVRFWVVGVRRVRGWSRFAPGRVPLRVFRPPALGCLAARRARWRLGARVLVGLVAPLFLPPLARRLSRCFSQVPPRFFLLNSTYSV